MSSNLTITSNLGSSNLGTSSLPLPALDTGTTRPPGRPRWPLFGIAAGVAGLASAMAAISDLPEEEVHQGVGVLDQIGRGRFHGSFVLGLVSIAALMLAAAGWRRWAEHHAPRDLAARTIGSALHATATVNIIFTALAGALALYLPGGADEGVQSNEALFVNFALLDFGQLLGWWGGMIAAGCAAVVALRRNRVLPRWIGVVSVVLTAPVLAIALLTGLPGLPGLVMPIWLVITSIGLLASRTA